jgi:hypothetical protein
LPAAARCAKWRDALVRELVDQLSFALLKLPKDALNRRLRLAEEPVFPPHPTDIRVVWSLGVELTFTFACSGRFFIGRLHLA